VNFKLQQYAKAAEHFKNCIAQEPQHPYAYNNLAFLYNMNQFYGETVNICKEAKESNRYGHNTHRHWAFAEFKQGNMVKAIKKIRKGVTKMPDSADNWVVWGHILRTAGKYNSAKHKFQRALKIDPTNKVAKSEMHVVENLIHFD
jgi:Tfp pilus assembly protein PilF